MNTTVEQIGLANLSKSTLAYWAACVLENPDLSPFHGPEWLRNWASAYGAVDDCFVLMSLNARGRVCGLLPMMRWQGTVRSLSYNASDYTGMVWAGHAVAAASIGDHLIRMAMDQTVLLWNIRATDPLVATLGARDRLELVNRTPVSSVRLPMVQLRPWRQLDPMSASGLERKRRRLARAGAHVSFASKVDAATLEQVFDVHSRSWAIRGQAGSFADPRRMQFLRKLNAGGPKLLFSVMRVKDALISYRVGPIDARSYFDWNTGTDPDHGRLSPGLVLLDTMLSRLSLSERVSSVDFLRGDEDYKRAWVTAAGWVSTYRCVPGSRSPLRGL